MKTVFMGKYLKNSAYKEMEKWCIRNKDRGVGQQKVMHIRNTKPRETLKSLERRTICTVSKE